MRLIRFVIAASVLFSVSGCNGDEQEQDVNSAEHATPTPMPASAPADTLVNAPDTAHGGHSATTTTDSAAGQTTTH